MLKVATYNLHSCIDLYGRVNPEKTCKVIAGLKADVIALQEVDVHRSRTAALDQPQWLAGRLGMDYCFHALLTAGHEQYGLAILSAVPLRRVKLGRLPAPALKIPSEVRGAMWVRLKTAGGDVHLVNTHLGLRAAERRVQISALLGKKWLARIPPADPVIVCGDFNAGPFSPVYRRLMVRLADVQNANTGLRFAKPTFFAVYPVLRLDHIFVSHHFRVLRAAVVTAPPARTASDHLPLLTELAIKSPLRHADEKRLKTALRQLEDNAEPS